MNSGATNTENTISGKRVGLAGVVEVGTGETTLFGGQNPADITLNFINISASSANLTVYLKPLAATTPADANTILKTFAIAADALFTLPLYVPQGYYVTALASATGINAFGGGMAEL